MRKFHIGARRLAAVVIGLVFLVSGLLKLIDPVGTTLKVAEYFSFFGLPLGTGAASAFGVILILTESILGAALVAGVFRRGAGKATILIISFFLIITAILWWKNPDMDCGCFGEAVHLSHSQSFWKNVVLLALALFAFIPLRQLGDVSPRKMVSFALVSASLVLALFYSYAHLPFVDFTEFKPGARLYASLDSEYMEDDDYVATFIYEKNGKKGSFTLDRLPDSTWTFVGVDTLMRSAQTRPADTPVLAIRDSEGNEMDAAAASGNVIVFTVHDPDKAPWQRIIRSHDAALGAGAKPLVLAASTPERMAGIPEADGLPVFYSDYKTLVTMCRANGGAVCIENGEIISKWSPKDFPNEQTLRETLGKDPLEAMSSFKVGRRVKAQGFALYILALLLLV